MLIIFAFYLISLDCEDFIKKENYMAAWRYGFNLLVLKTSLTRSLRSLVKGKIRMSAQPCNILYISVFIIFYIVLSLGCNDLFLSSKLF